MGGAPSSSPEPFSGDLFGELQLAEMARSADSPTIRDYFPGLTICAVASGAAAWLSDHYDVPVILLGLLIGLSLNFAARDPRTHRGLDLASQQFLRIGIVLLGFQVSTAQIMALGIGPFGALLAIMAIALAAGLIGARLSRQSRYAGLLAGGATAICGASAALALYGVIGKDRLGQAEFALTLVGVSMASALAMSLYPVIAAQLELTDAQAGYLIGASIHDVGQAIGGAYDFSDAAGAYATIVKLARVTMLAPVVLLASLWIGPAASETQRPLWRRLSVPWFITLFLAVVAVNSALTLPVAAATTSLTASKALLLLAVTATAMRSRTDLLLGLGWRAAAPVAAASLASFAAALLFLGLGVGS
jgi:uncharacterized integral membrane protein (TIGR00698 family)